MPNLAHFQQEIEASGIDAGIVELNFKPVHGSIAFEHLFGHCAVRLQAGDHPLNSKWMRIYKKYDATEGWIVSGINPLNDFEQSDTVRYKVAVGEILDQDGKPIKYVTPKGKQTPVIFLNVPRYVWEKVAARYGRNVDFGSYKNFWEWVIKDNIPIYITEGEKKAGALLSKGYVAISIPGVWTGTRKDKITEKHSLVADLIPFDTLGRQIHILFDHEKNPQKKFNIGHAAFTLAINFKNASLSIGYPPGPEKGIDDYLVAGRDVDNIRFKLLSELQAESFWNFTFQPDIEINQKYMGDIELPDSGIVFLKGGMGCGKTELAAKAVSKAIGKGRRTLGVVHRISLGRSMGEKLGLPFIADSKGFLTKGHDKDLGFTLCINSLHSESQAKIKAEDWSGSILFLDEWESVCQTMLNDHTLKKHRKAILKTFRDLVRHVSDTGGLVIVADADLSDVSCQFLLNLCESPIKPTVIVNNYKPDTGYTATIFDDKDPYILLNKLYSLLDKRQKTWVQTGGQKVSSTWGTINLETAIKSRYPHLKVLRIDSESVADKNHPAFGATGCINQVVVNYDVVVSSPSISSGISIDVPHFDAWFGISHGNTPIFEFLQSTFRIRQYIPRYIWAKNKGCYEIGDGSCSPKALLASKDRNVRLNLKLLRLEFELNSDNDIFLKTWAKLAARVNAASWNFKETVINRLKLQGHTVVTNEDDNGGDDFKSLKDEMKEIKKTAIEAEAVAVVGAKDLTQAEFEELQDKLTRTESERLSEKKYKCCERYGVEPTTTLKILSDVRGWYLQLLRNYLVNCGSEILEMRETKKLMDHLNNNGGNFYLPDLNLGIVGIKMLKSLDILQFCDPARVWTKHSHEVQRFVTACLKIKKDIKTFLGITISEELAEKTPIMIVQRLLRAIGYKLSGKRRRIRGSDERVWEFSFGGFSNKLEATAAPDLRASIFEAWKQRDAEDLAKAAAPFNSYGKVC